MAYSATLTDSFTTLSFPVAPVQIKTYPNYTFYKDVDIGSRDLATGFWSSNAGPMTYVLTNGVTGLSLSSAGILTGTPTQLESDVEHIVATNPIGSTGSQPEFWINIVDAPVIVPTDGGGLMLNLQLNI